MRYGTGAALVLLAGVLWSFQGLVIRLIEEAGTWQVLFWRSAAMAAVLTIFGMATTGRGPLAQVRSVGLAGVLGGLGLIFAFGGAIFALQSTSVAMAVFLFSASPFLAAVLGRVLLKEDVRRATWLAIGLAAIGIFIMVGEGLATGALMGNVAALLSGLGFAAFTVSLRWGRLADMMPAVVLGGVFSMLAAAIMIAVTGQSLLVSPRDLALIALMGVVTLAGGMMLYTIGSRVVPAAEATLLSLMEVLLAPIWVWLFLTETATRSTLIGGAVLVAAVAFNAASGMRRKRVPPMV